MSYTRRLALFVVIFAGCSKSSSGSSQEAPSPAPGSGSVAASGSASTPAVDAGAAPTPAPPAVPPPVVELVDPGAEPRAPLRFQFSATGKHTLEVVTESSAKPVPKVTFVVDAQILEVLPTGDARVELVIVSAEAARSEALPPNAHAATQKTLDGLRALKITETIDPTGATRDVTVDLPPGLEPMLQKALDFQSFSMLAAGVPAEPLGKGARWKVTEAAPDGSAALETTFTLVETDGKVGVIESTATESQAKQSFDDGKTKFDILDYKATGTSKRSFDLGSPFGALTNQVDSTYTMVQADKRHEISMTQVTTVTLK